ncbi:hypothetical protein L7F22_030283 [Adiantum nelumboides]|nr:hypothetical protein [Adiantum nelumboides]
MALASSANSCVVTFVTTEYNQKVYEEREGTAAVDQTSGRLRMVGLSDGLPLDALYDRHSPAFISSMHLHWKPQLEGLLEKLNASPTPVSCIITDLFMPWLHSLDLHRRPPLIGFSPTCAAQFAAIYRLPQLVARGQLSGGALDESLQNTTSTTTVSVLPGVLAFKARNLPWYTEDPQDDAHVLQFLMNIRQQFVPRFRAMVINSFMELEGDIVQALAVQEAEASRMKILTLGPLLLLHQELAAPPTPRQIISEIAAGDGDAEETLGEPVGTDSQDSSKKECWQWLEEKEEGSVLYISFGTTASVSRKELQELALGIEAAGVPFLWTIRADQLTMRGEDALPVGFVERTKEKAFFTPWAPQTLVLSHRSVGAFLTHGGWNSAIEAMSMGVPMLTWPCTVDQKGNSELIVERWKVGLPLREWGSAEELAVSREKVEKLVTCLLHKREGQQIRERAAAVKREARGAVAKGGSSQNCCRQLIDLIANLSTAPS